MRLCKSPACLRLTVLPADVLQTQPSGTTLGGRSAISVLLQFTRALGAIQCCMYRSDRLYMQPLCSPLGAEIERGDALCNIIQRRRGEDSFAASQK